MDAEQQNQHHLKNFDKRFNDLFGAFNKLETQKVDKITGPCY